jgi:putative cell wall-binding protein
MGDNAMRLKSHLIVAAVATAALLTVPVSAQAADDPVPNADVVESPSTTELLRAISKTYQITGADRYEVAANTNYNLFPDNLPVVYIASGEKYPDALSAGPAAALQGGAMLLVAADSIPLATQEALQGLQPQRLVVVGGPATISDAVYEQLAQFQPNISRIGGADRYEVSRNIIDDTFCGGPEGECTIGADQIFVATGANFPDALVAGPAAAEVSGAVLLVPGSATTIDEASTALLTRLGTTDAYIAGGAASVSPEIETALAAAVPGTVERFGGADRFEVAATINAGIFSAPRDYVFVASGAVFPDALSGGPAAAQWNAPMFLVRQNCTPAVAAAGVEALDATNAILLGGPNTVSLEALSNLC